MVPHSFYFLSIIWSMGVNVMSARNKAIPTLSSQGWVTALEVQVDSIFSWFLTSDYSQSVLYHGQIRSLPWIIQRYERTPNALTEEIRRVLDDLFGRYFDSARTSADYEEVNDPSTNRYNLLVSCTIENAGKEYNLSRLISVVNGKVSKINDLSEGN